MDVFGSRYSTHHSHLFYVLPLTMEPSYILLIITKLKRQDWASPSCLFGYCFSYEILSQVTNQPMVTNPWSGDLSLTSQRGWVSCDTKIQPPCSKISQTSCRLELSPSKGSDDRGRPCPDVFHGMETRFLLY